MFCCPDCYVTIDVSLSDCQRQRDGKRQNSVLEGSFGDEVCYLQLVFSEVRRHDIAKVTIPGNMICNKTFTRARMGNPSYEKKIQKNHHLVSNGT